ncbi:MAG TPA: ABC transporter permease [Bauldia sp.]|nr:ABC transporter permease [Bauldia sp.]
MDAAKTSDFSGGVRRAFSLRAVLLRPELTAFVGVIVVFAFFALTAGDSGFLSFTGTKKYLQVAAEIGILATPVTLLLVAGEFDLSVGTMIAAGGIAVAFPISFLHWPLWASICSGLVVAGIVGAANGFLVLRLGMPSFLATLGMMFFLRGATLGLTLMMTGATQIFRLKESLAGDPLLPFFSGTPLGLPVAIYWWLASVAVAAYILANTRWGNWIYASGGDREAAVKMGIPVARLKVTLYILTAISAVVVAMVEMFYVDITDVTQGLGKEFEAITAAVVGGAAISGGIGSPIGTALGTLMFGMISQGFFYTDINDNWYYAFVGAMLVAVVTINSYTRRAAMRQGRSK